MQLGRLNGRCRAWAGPWERRILLRERNGKGFCFLRMEWLVGARCEGRKAQSVFGGEEEAI